mmetsp:Transcript_8889/g.24868  ORF Transcript_8889/g.24868 Transcript_8889/m.24868 type:complete len:463 (-) Transcript_8889:14-1402(-)
MMLYPPGYHNMYDRSREQIRVFTQPSKNCRISPIDSPNQSYNTDLSEERPGGVGGTAVAREHRAVEVRVGELDALHVLLLRLEHLAVLEEDVEVHAGGIEGHRGAALGVHEEGTQRLDAGRGDPLADLVVVDAGAEGAEEIDGLAVEGADEHLDVLLLDAVSLEDAAGDADAVLEGGGPVVLLHASVTDERGVEGGEIVTGGDDGHARDLLNLVLAGELHVGWVIREVHQGGVHHLVVDGVLGGATHASGTGVEIVDEEGGHAALLDDVGSLAVALADELSGLTGVAGLELTGGHDDGGDAELLEHKHGLEGLTLTLTTPHAEDEGNLDLGELHEVLADVDGDPVHETLGDVVSLVGHVVEVLETVGDVVGGGHDGVVGAAEAEAALELGVDHVAAAGDVLLVVRDVLVHALPAGHHHGLGAVALAEGGGRGAELVARDAGDRLGGRRDDGGHGNSRHDVSV